MNLQHPKIVIFGSGVIGGTIGAWLLTHHENVYFLARPPTSDVLSNKGLTTFGQGDHKSEVNFKVRVILDLDEARDVDIIVLAVKNYSLESAAKTIHDKVGDHPFIIAAQNGLENQVVLPKYFSKIIYAIVSYNAWSVSPGVISYQSRGPLVFATEDNQLLPQVKQIAELFNRGVKTIVSQNLQEVVHTKLILNLANSLTTLVGLQFRPLSDPDLFQKLLINLTYEGVKIVKAIGLREAPIPGMPRWRTMFLASRFPLFLTRGVFKKNLKKMVISSMAQDIIGRGSQVTELETINGHLLKQARNHQLKVPYNEAVYQLCRQEFAKKEFSPLDVREVWDHVRTWNEG